MPYSTKPIPAERRDRRAVSVGQRIQGYWWHVSDERKVELRALWPEMVAPIEELNRVLQLPIIGGWPDNRISPTAGSVLLERLDPWLVTAAHLGPGCSCHGARPRPRPRPLHP
jgi:hypothetical protein